MYQLLPWQDEDADWIAKQNCILASDCGTGKTIIAVESVRRHARGPVLVIAPRLTKEWWAETVREQEAGYPGVCESAGRGIPWERVRQWEGSKLLWVIVHPTAVRLNYGKMLKIDWDTIIVDEAHRFKNRNAKQTRALWKLHARRKIMLTATPWGNSPADMWALLHYLYPKSYTSYWRFYDKYVDYYQPQGQRFRKVNGGKNLRQLAAEVAPYYRKRRKEDVLDLPPLLYKDIPIALSPKQAALYRQLVNEAYAELYGKEVIIENAIVRLLRLQQCSLDPGLMAEGLPAFTLNEVPAKVEWLNEWLEDHPDEPVVITSRFRKFVEKWLVNLAPDAVIVGGMKERDVQKAIAHFNKHGRLVGTLDAIKEGLNLQYAQTMIVMDGTYSSVAEYQLSQRIHRIGQVGSHQVIHLVGKFEDTGKWTVDKLIRRAVQEKFDRAKLIEAFIKELHE